MNLIVNLLTSKKIICKNLPAEQVLLPSMDGIIGILEGHVTSLTCLDIGLVSIKTDGKWIPVLSGGDGVAEIDRNRVTIVGPNFDEFTDLGLDLKKAKKEVEDAVANFQDFESGRSFPEALKRLKRANAQLAGIQLLTEGKTD